MRTGPALPLVESLPEPAHLVLEADHHPVQRLHGDDGDARQDSSRVSLFAAESAALTARRARRERRK
jgi:hypothetical protein